MGPEPSRGQQRSTEKSHIRQRHAIRSRADNASHSSSQTLTLIARGTDLLLQRILFCIPILELKGMGENRTEIWLDAHFAAWDYVICAGMLSFSTLIGFYYACSGGKQRTQHEWLAGNQNLDWLPTSLSLLASFISAITLLGTPSVFYTNGVMYSYLALCYFAVMPLTAFIFMPVFRRTHSISAFKYLEKRFNKTVSLIPCFVYMVQMTVYMGIVLYSPALALNAVTGLSLEGSIVVVAVVCLFYTVIGGMKAIVVTDAFQTIVMVVGMITIAVAGTWRMGGLSSVLDINRQGEHLDFKRWSLDPRTRHAGVDCLIGGIFTWLSVYGSNQAQVQRYISIGRKVDAHKAILLNMPGLIFLMLISGYCGLLAYAKYALCDPIKAGVLSKPDQILPYYVTDTFRDWPGFAGLFVSSIFSGSLSTISSGVNALAAIVLTNIVPLNYFKETQGAKAGKLMAVGFGLVAMVFAFLCQYLEAILTLALSMYGILSAPLLGLFTLGMLCPRSNSTGAFVGYITSVLFQAWMYYGSQQEDYSGETVVTFTTNCSSVHHPQTMASHIHQLAAAQEEFGGVFSPATDTSEWGLLSQTVFRMSYLYFAVVGFSITVGVGYATSLLSRLIAPTNVDLPDLDLLFHWQDLHPVHEFDPYHHLSLPDHPKLQQLANKKESLKSIKSIEIDENIL